MITIATHHPMKILLLVRLTLVCCVVLAIPGLLHKNRDMPSVKDLFWSLSQNCLLSEEFISTPSCLQQDPPFGPDTKRLWDRKRHTPEMLTLQECLLGRHLTHQCYQLPRYNQLCSLDGLGRFPIFIWFICKGESHRGEGLLIRARELLDKGENTSAGA